MVLFDNLRVNLRVNEWALVEALFCAEPARSERRGRPRVEARSVVNAVLWVLTGEGWSKLPGRYPSPPTYRRRFDEWQGDGTLAEIVKRLASNGLGVSLRGCIGSSAAKPPAPPRRDRLRGACSGPTRNRGARRPRWPERFQHCTGAVHFRLPSRNFVRAGSCPRSLPSHSHSVMFGSRDFSVRRPRSPSCRARTRADGSGTFPDETTLCQCLQRFDAAQLSLVSDRTAPRELEDIHHEAIDTARLQRDVGASRCSGIRPGPAAAGIRSVPGHQDVGSRAAGDSRACEMTPPAPRSDLRVAASYNL